MINILFSSCSFSDSVNSFITRGAKDSDMNLLNSVTVGNTEAAIEAIKSGANIDHLSGSLNERTDHGTPEKNPFRIACFLGKFNVAECLVEHGADVNCLDADGNPILAYTTSTYNLKLCKLLVEHGADINKVGKSGYTALDYLFLGNASNVNADITIDQMMTYLLKNGAKITSKTLSAALKGNNNDGYCKYTIIQKVLKKYLESGQKSNLSPLLEAAILGNNDKVDSLLSSGQIPGDDEKKVLFYTAAFGNVKNLKILSGKGISTNLKDDDGNSLLAVAAKSGNTDMMQYLISSQMDLEAENCQSCTALEAAVINDQYNSVKVLLSKGAKIPLRPTAYNSDALSNASKNGDLNMVKLLIEYGYPKENTNMAMCIASQYNQTEILKYLLSIGINPDSELNQETALGYACSFDSMEALKLLLDNGASADGGSVKGEPLNDACLYGKTEIAQYLADKGANVNLVYKYKDGSSTDTALLQAVKSGSYEIIKLLVQHGAEVNYKDADGNTVLMNACMYGSKNIIEYLIQKGAKINDQNSEGQTALIIAAGSGYTDNVRILLKYNADKNIKDKSGYTAVNTKKAKNDSEIRKILNGNK